MDGNLYAMTPGYCGHCGGYHQGSCPRVKAIEYHPNGTVKRIEYHDPNPIRVVESNWDGRKVDQDGLKELPCPTCGGCGFDHCCGGERADECNPDQ